MKTTKKHFKLFCDEAIKWQNILGLKDVSISFDHSWIEEDVFAQCHYSSEGKCALLELNDTWPDAGYPLDDENIKLSAFHEVCHIFTGDLVSKAKSRFVMEHEIIELDHRIVRMLENVLFPKY